MPCAERELCTIPGLMPEPPNGHASWKALAWGARTTLMTRKRTVTMRGRVAGAPCHRLTLKIPRALDSGGGRQLERRLPPAEGQDGVHRSARVQASAAGGHKLFFF